MSNLDPNCERFVQEMIQLNAVGGILVSKAKISQVFQDLQSQKISIFILDFKHPFPDYPKPSLIVIDQGLLNQDRPRFMQPLHEKVDYFIELV